MIFFRSIGWCVQIIWWNLTTEFFSQSFRINSTCQKYEYGTFMQSSISRIHTFHCNWLPLYVSSIHVTQSYHPELTFVLTYTRTNKFCKIILYVFVSMIIPWAISFLLSPAVDDLYTCYLIPLLLPHVRLIYYWWPDICCKVLSLRPSKHKHLSDISSNALKSSTLGYFPFFRVLISFCFYKFYKIVSQVKINRNQPILL